MSEWIMYLLYAIGGVIGLIVAIFILAVIREVILWFFGVGDINRQLSSANFKLASLVEEMRSTRQLVSEINNKIKYENARHDNNIDNEK